MKSRKTLNAEIVFVMSQGTDTPEQLNERIELTRSSFGGAKKYQHHRRYHQQTECAG
ncbi:phosphate acetyltransferase [Salmonella enterica subsp. enterica]|uniref:Phosphate acetyltransferase n=1 Tax=Salmonella enterica I TaxID=59201 RepID=A0A447TZ35_SALET|nr:phosphate acetyltransferase [Salmonella enterica subsp. enterica]